MGDMGEISVSRARALAVFAIAGAVLFLAGKLLLGAGTARSSPALVVQTSAGAAARPVLVVHVVGAVSRPGLYRLRDGARVADAIDRAGGETPKADLALVNLAAPLADGQQVVVPRRAPAGAAAGDGSAAAGPVHLNTATLEQLDALPGVGPVTAQKILDYREQHGAFSSVDDLDAIPGIGPARLEQLREVVAP